MKRSKVLLISPSELKGVFSKSKLSVAIPDAPSLTLASLAVAIRKQHDVKVLDLCIVNEPLNELTKTLKEFKPDYVGITFTTPSFDEASKIADLVKSHDKDIILIAGGVHTSSLPEETLINSRFDIAVIGEGEKTLLEIANGEKLDGIKGIYFKKDGVIHKNPLRELIENIDELPFPAWDLFDIKKYKSPRLTSKKSPVGKMESSRGCPFACTYCNKCIFKRRFRAKSVNRVVDEIEYMLKIGFKEIHIEDDCFTADIERAKKICDEIIRRKLKLYMNFQNGIRVDRVDEELFHKMKKAGCYRVSLGVESGNQEILNKIKKGTNLEQLRKAFKLAKKAKIETIGFFMVALPGDTKETIDQTIEFAKELKPDIVKIGITIPFPGTELYNELDSQGLIKSKDWRYYNYHNPNKIYNHENLSWEEIYAARKNFYKQIYLDPAFIYRRFIRGIRTGEIFYDIFYFLKSLKYDW
ncbi:MAG: radical SAM protein [Nanoarchaeota archaeon]|nr:radical SAM protein [Nanoarchaeota archaeon]